MPLKRFLGKFIPYKLKKSKKLLDSVLPIWTKQINKTW